MLIKFLKILIKLSNHQTNGKEEKINSEIERYNNRNNLLIKKIRENQSDMEISVKILMSLIWDIDRM